MKMIDWIKEYYIAFIIAIMIIVFSFIMSQALTIIEEEGLKNILEGIWYGVGK